MHINPEETWHKAEAAIADSAEQLRQLIEDGIPLRPHAVTVTLHEVYVRTRKYG